MGTRCPILTVKVWKFASNVYVCLRVVFYLIFLPFDCLHLFTLYMLIFQNLGSIIYIFILFFLQGCIKLIQSEKDIHNVYQFQNLNFRLIKKSSHKYVFTQILSITRLSTLIIKKYNWAANQHTSEWFLKIKWLRYLSNDTENSALCHRNKW